MVKGNGGRRPSNPGKIGRFSNFPGLQQIAVVSNVTSKFQKNYRDILSDSKIILTPFIKKNTESQMRWR